MRKQREESERRDQFQQRQQQQQQQQSQIIRPANANNYESIARQEYFINREAAKKIREKVLAYEFAID